jgi:hypothetical protein
MLLVGGWPEAGQRFECRIPHPKLAPAGETHEDRVPIAVALGHVAPGRAGAQNPKNAVDRSPLVFYRRATLAPVGQKWVENLPFRVSQIAPTQCCLPKKGSLESFTYEKIVNTA